MQAWQGRTDSLIDRFDVRAGLDYIEEYDGANDEEFIFRDGEDESMAHFEAYRDIIIHVSER